MPQATCHGLLPCALALLSFNSTLSLLRCTPYPCHAMPCHSPVKNIHPRLSIPCSVQLSSTNIGDRDAMYNHQYSPNGLAPYISPFASCKALAQVPLLVELLALISSHFAPVSIGVFFLPFSICCLASYSTSCSVAFSVFRFSSCPSCPSSVS